MNLSFSYITLNILFGLIGTGAFIYGKKTGGAKAMLLGLALIVFPYFVEDTLTTFLVGAALTAAVFLWKDEHDN